MTQITKLEKLCNSQSAITSAYKAGFCLQETGWMRYPAACWDKPAIVAFDGGNCVAGINYHEDNDDLIFFIDFAWCNPSNPKALSALMIAIRGIIRDSKCVEVQFTCHEGNKPMARMVDLLNLTPVSHTYRFVAP